MNIPNYRTEEEQARRLGKTVRTLQLWRQQGRGLRYVKAGMTVLYPFDAEAEYLKAQEQVPVRSRRNRDHAAVRRRNQEHAIA
jgi:hypothetical protein